MAPSAANAVVGQGGTVYYAATAAAASPPTSATSTLTNYFDLGYLDENGVTITVTPTLQEFNVWQSLQPIRRGLQNQTISVSGAFAEWNVSSVPRAFGGGTLTGGGGLGTVSGSFAFLDPSSATALEEFGTVADITDGTDKHRFWFPRVNQTEASAVQFNRQNLAVLPFNFGVLAPAGGGSPGGYYTIAA